MRSDSADWTVTIFHFRSQSCFPDYPILSELSEVNCIGMHVSVLFYLKKKMICLLKPAVWLTWGVDLVALNLLFIQDQFSPVGYRLEIPYHSDGGVRTMASVLIM